MILNVKQNWYTCFDPVGTMGNVHFLIVNRPEHVAGRGAQAIATALDQPMVTLKLLKKRDKPFTFGGNAA